MEVNVGGGIRQPIVKPERRLLTGGFIENYLRYTSEHEGSPKFHRWTAISLLAGVLGRKVFLDRVYYTTFPNLYILIVGPAGIVKKSTTTAIGVDLLREIPGFAIMADQVTQASMIDAMQACGHQFDFPGETEPHTQSPLYVYASEFKVMISEVHGTLPEMFTTFFDCTPRNHKKAWRRETKGGGLIEIFGPCINMLGCSTSAWLKDCITVSQLEGGFASRILYVIDNALPDKFVAIPQHFPELMALKPKLVNDLLWIHHLAGHATMSPDAKEFFTLWYRQNRIATAAMGSSRFSGYRGRMSTMVEKLSMIMSVNEGDSLVVERHHIERAIDLLTDLESGMMEAFEASGDNPEGKGMKRVFDCIATRGRATEIDLLNSLWLDVSIKDIQAHVQSLLQMKAIRMELHGSIVCYLPLAKTLSEGVATPSDEASPG